MNLGGPKIYVLATGEVYQKLKDKKIIVGLKGIDMTNTYGIGGPLDHCATTRFVGTDEWQCFDTLEEAREAASKL
jgi:hypothetical protein